jgi:prepilin-type N-terminal cleavage/methylation domain-containing protein
MKKSRTDGFTLVELLVTIAILSVVAGMAVYLVSGVQNSGETQAVQAELVTIRKACLRFKADMGEPPRYLAELLQSPSSSNGLGGWWWRTDGTPAARLRSFDPVVGRGWNGPYLCAELTSAAAEEASESRTNAGGVMESISSDNSAGKHLTLLRSEYGCHPQKKDGDKTLSHFQLDFSVADRISVRFLHDPLQTPCESNVVARLDLGLKP